MDNERLFFVKKNKVNCKLENLIYFFVLPPVIVFMLGAFILIKIIISSWFPPDIEATSGYTNLTSQNNESKIETFLVLPRHTKH